MMFVRQRSHQIVNNLSELLVDKKASSRFDSNFMCGILWILFNSVKYSVSSETAIKWNANTTCITCATRKIMMSR